MALYRQIQTTFWEDEKVVDEFTPEDRYFMLYLMTNPHTNLLGCYSITIRQMEFETGYNKDTILKLLARFKNVLNVACYDDATKEILIYNWHKYNWSKSPKMKSALNKEISIIKSEELKKLINTVCIQYGYGMDTVSPAIALAIEKERVIEREEENPIKTQEKPIGSCWVNNTHTSYGEFNNVYLTERQKNEFDCLVLNKEVANNIIDELSENIASNREKIFNEEYPDMHFIRLKKYWQNYKKRPKEQPVEEYASRYREL